MTTPVPFDPELAQILHSWAESDAPMADPHVTLEDIPKMRGGATGLSLDEAIGELAIVYEERIIPGPAGAPEIAVTIIRPKGSSGAAGAQHALPCLYNIHGGGTITGDRSQDNTRLVQLVAELGVVAVNVEYRLAPEHPAPAPVEDCYAGLCWTVEQASELGIDPKRVVVMGGSAGGGLSAGVALLARDRGGPQLAGQLLLCPMLDDTNSKPSSYQYDGFNPWPRHMSVLAWRALLGEGAGDAEAEVHVYSAPARMRDLSNLPPAFIEAGSAELFRDEDVEYASRIWATGGQAELHIWSGAFHGFDMFATEHPITQAALASRFSWLRRILAL